MEASSRRGWDPGVDIVWSVAQGVIREESLGVVQIANGRFVKDIAWMKSAMSM